MEYEEAREWLYGRQESGIKLGLDNIIKLLKAIGADGTRIPIIHVAGTNGKGSTCAFIDSILRQSGYKTGLFTSPHLISFCERIRVNGKPITKIEIAKRIKIIKDLVNKWDEEPTFFEITTALALKFFIDEKVDVATIEVGLGGRLDSTNAVQPTVCVITPISLDHQHILGNSIAKIAREKAGIIKSGKPVISAHQSIEAKAVLESRCNEVNTSIDFVDDTLTFERISLKGKHQKANASLAIAAVKKFSPSINNKDCFEGVAKTVWRGRFEQYHQREGFDIVVDGAHNKEGAQALLSTWNEIYGENKATVIFASAANKDLESIIVPIGKVASHLILTKPKTPRELASYNEVIKHVSKNIQVEREDSVLKAIKVAKESKRNVLIAGSLFLVAEALAILDDKSQNFEPSDQ